MLIHADRGAGAGGVDLEHGVVRQCGYFLGGKGKQHLVQGDDGKALVAHADEHAAVGGLGGFRRDGAVEQVLIIMELVCGAQRDLGLDVLRRHRNQRGVYGLQ